MNYWKTKRKRKEQKDENSVRFYGEGSAWQRRQPGGLSGQGAADREHRDRLRLHAALRAAGGHVQRADANQAPGDADEIHQFCTLKFGTEFPQFKKIDVNGENAEPLFAFLAAEKPFAGFGKGLKNAALSKFADMNNKQFGDKAYIKWNFTKFLIDREGKVIARFEPTEDMKEVRNAVIEELK